MVNVFCGSACVGFGFLMLTDLQILPDRLGNRSAA